MLILAGAGSGKTTVLVSRAGRLVHDRVVPAASLCVLTFTNKAARELKSRVSEKLGKAGDRIWAGTFHSFGLSLLKQFGHHIGLPKRFSVIDQRDAGDLIKELLGDYKHYRQKAFDVETLLTKLGTWRDTGQTETHSQDPYEEATEYLLPRYQTRLKRLGLIDFDGLLHQPLELLGDPTIGPTIRQLFTQVMVDEFQDTNPIQMRLLEKLTQEHKNLTVVGDDDQAIYGWRGACVSNILEFPKRFRDCKVVRLERNYRCAEPILTLANAIIANNTSRHAKILKACGPVRDAGRPELLIFEDEQEEADWVAREIDASVRKGTLRSEIAVLYRSNGQSALFEAELRRLGIEYRVSGGTAFFDRREIRDVLAFIRCCIRPHDVAFRRILNLPPRGLGEKTFERIHLFAEGQRLSFVAAARRATEAGCDPKSVAAIAELFQFLDKLKATLLQPGNPGAAVIAALETLGYRAFLKQLSPDGVAAERRWKVIETFGGVIDRFFQRRDRTPKTVQQFVEGMELRDDGEDDEPSGKVALMTLHACKGLEFEHVYLAGLEEDLLPHKSLGSDVQEERRLFYVGATRAKRQLVLTRVKARQRHGRRVETVPSRFLSELPAGLLDVHESCRPLGEDGRAALMRSLFEKLKA
jgi:DNA helicase-2/ATP-dependent DNA helicase PcrA